MPVAFLASSLVAYVGGHTINYALILYLQERVGSGLLAGIGFALCFGSSLVFGWAAGAYADRVSPVRMIHIAHACFLLCLGGLAAANAFAPDAWLPWAVLASALLGGIGWSIFGPARMAALGRITDTAHLRPVTILFNLTVMIGFGLAPLLIGVARAHGGWPPVFAMSAACYLVSSLLLVSVRTPMPAREEPVRILTAVKAGFAAIRARPLLAQFMMAAVIGLAVTGPLQLLLPRLARDILGLSEVARGAFLGLFALALIVGGIIALPLGSRIAHGRTIFVGVSAVGLLFASLALPHTVLTASLTLGALGIAAGLAVSFIVAGIQLHAPEAMRGRIMGTYSIVSQVVPSLSGVLAGALLQAVGVLPALALSGMALFAAGVVAARAMPELRRWRH